MKNNLKSLVNDFVEGLIYIFKGLVNTFSTEPLWAIYGVFIVIMISSVAVFSISGSWLLFMIFWLIGMSGTIGSIIIMMGRHAKRFKKN